MIREIYWGNPENLQGATRYISYDTIAKDENLKTICPYNGKNINYERKRVLRNFDLENCMKQTIAVSVNCSSKSCEQILYNLYEFESTGIHFGQNRQYYSFGGQLHGFRYSIFVNKQRIKDISADFYALKLLTPFDFPLLDFTVYDNMFDVGAKGNRYTEQFVLLAFWCNA